MANPVLVEALDGISLADAVRLGAHLLNYLLSFFFWLILGERALALLSRGKTTFFTGLFRLGTSPVIRVVRFITPAAVGDAHIPWLALPLLLALRILLAPAL